MSKSGEWQTDRGPGGVSPNSKDPGVRQGMTAEWNNTVYEPPGLSRDGEDSWLHAFAPWAHFVLRPWNPSRYSAAPRYFPFQIAINGLLAALVVDGWVATGGVRAGILAGLGLAAFVVASGVLLSFVAGELGAPGVGERIWGVAIDASCALVLTLLLFRFGLVIAGFASLFCYLVDLVCGLRCRAGFSRLRSVAAVYLAIEVGMVSVSALGFGMVLALRG